MQRTGTCIVVCVSAPQYSWQHGTVPQVCSSFITTHSSSAFKKTHDESINTNTNRSMQSLAQCLVNIPEYVCIYKFILFQKSNKQQAREREREINYVNYLLSKERMQALSAALLFANQPNKVLSYKGNRRTMKNIFSFGGATNNISYLVILVTYVS